MKVVRIPRPQPQYDEYEIGASRVWYGPPQKSLKPRYVVFAADRGGQWLDQAPVLAWETTPQKAVVEAISPGRYRIDPEIVSTVFVVPLYNSPCLGWYVDIRKVN